MRAKPSLMQPRAVLEGVATASDFLCPTSPLCVRQSDRLEMSCLLGTSVAECTVLEAGDMRQALCAEFSLPPEPQTLRL